MSNEAEAETRPFSRQQQGHGSRGGNDNVILPEVLRLVRDMSAKVDRQERELGEIRLRLERGNASIEAANSNGTTLREVRDEMIVLKTRFAIVWAALGVAGTAGVSGVVLGAFALMRH